MSSRPESELLPRVSDTFAYRRPLQDYELLYPPFIRHFTRDDRRSHEWTEENRPFQFYRGGLDGANRPERPTSAKVSENRGTREPATWIYVPHKFMRLRGPFFRSRIPFANLPFSLFPCLSLSLLLAPLPSFYPSTPALSFLTGAFRHSAGSSPPTRMNPSWLRSVCYLLSSEISRSICYRRGWVLCGRSRGLRFMRLLQRQEQKSRCCPGVPWYFMLS